MKSIHSIVASLAFLCVMLFASIGQAKETSAIESWMPEQTQCIAVVDLQTLKLKSEYVKFKKYLANVLPRTFSESNEFTDFLKEFENGFDTWESQIDKFCSVGASKAYVIVDANLQEHRMAPFFVVLPVDSGKYSEVQKLVENFSQGTFIPEDFQKQWRGLFFIKAYKENIVLAINPESAPVDEEIQNDFFETLSSYVHSGSNKKVTQLFNRISDGKESPFQIYLFANGPFVELLEEVESKVREYRLAPNTIINGVQAIAMELDVINDDVHFQVLSKDAQSAQTLYKSIPTIKSILLDKANDSYYDLESRLFTRDLINHAFDLLNPSVKDDTLNLSVKDVFNRFEKLLPKWKFNASSGLYAPTTEEVKNEAKRIYSLAAPFINTQTVAVVHLDTVDFDGAFENTGNDFYKELKRLFPETFSGKSDRITSAYNRIKQSLKDIDDLCKRIHNVGGRDIYFIFSRDHNIPIKVIVPFEKSKKSLAQKLFFFLRNMRFLTQDQIEELENRYFRVIYNNCLVFGIKGDPYVSKEEFLANLKQFTPEDVPEIQKAFESSWSYTTSDKSIALSRVQAVLNVQALGTYSKPILQPLREELEEYQPELAKVFPAFTDSQLENGASIIALEIHPEKTFLNLHVISKDKQSAQDLASFIKKLKPFASQLCVNVLLRDSPLRESAPKFTEAISQDAVDILYNLLSLEVQDNVLSVRSNKVIKEVSSKVLKIDLPDNPDDKQVDEEAKSNNWLWIFIGGGIALLVILSLIALFCFTRK